MVTNPNRWFWIVFQKRDDRFVGEWDESHQPPGTEATRAESVLFSLQTINEADLLGEERREQRHGKDQTH